MKHRLSIVLALFAVVVTSTALAAAELRWVGKWKINAAKSDFAQQTVTHAPAGPGETQWTAEGMTDQSPYVSLRRVLPPPAGQADQARAEEQQRCRFGDRSKSELPADFAIRVCLCMNVDIEATGFGKAHEVYDVLVSVDTGRRIQRIRVTEWRAYV